MDNNKWISSHIYFDGDIYGKECDMAIISSIKPFIEIPEIKKRIKIFFFIRYNDIGSHIRFRMYGDKYELDQIVKPEYDKYINANILKMGIRIGKCKRKQLHSSLLYHKWIDYKPEVLRYGGDKAIKIAEKYFYYSSLVAMDIIKSKMLNDFNSRLGQGIIYMLIVLFHFTNNITESISIMTCYVNDISEYPADDIEGINKRIELFQYKYNKQSKILDKVVETIWNMLDNKIELPSTYQEYNTYTYDITNELHCLCKSNEVLINYNTVNDWNLVVNYIVPSYIHMMNNRIGISRKNESYLSYIIARSLKEMDIKKKSDVI
jgi:thiopeptide-type bacteriocin biosynthesis protein